MSRMVIFAVQSMRNNRYFFEIAYKGTRYHGWQMQANAVSIQQVVQEKLRQITGRSITVVGSGRTDTGVHAKQQFFHADFEKALDAEDFRYHLNAVLPEDIALRSVRRVREDAHARYDAVSREYVYEILTEKDPFRINEAYIYPRAIDIDKVNAAARLLMGKHDFESFSKVKTDVNHFCCEVMQAVWETTEGGCRFTISANRFLRGMVRAVVGTLLMVNEKKIAVEDVREIMDARDRSKAGRTVPPEGLYLNRVIYPEEIFID